MIPSKGLLMRRLICSDCTSLLQGLSVRQIHPQACCEEQITAGSAIRDIIADGIERSRLMEWTHRDLGEDDGSER